MKEKPFVMFMMTADQLRVLRNNRKVVTLDLQLFASYFAESYVDDEYKNREFLFYYSIIFNETVKKQSLCAEWK
jgi:hypothetical protein